MNKVVFIWRYFYHSNRFTIMSFIIEGKKCWTKYWIWGNANLCGSSCVSENIRSLGKRKYADQMLWVVRVISTYVTFYKAEIPARYLMELDKGLPQRQSVKIQRWPANNDLRAGFDLAEPNGRRSVLTAFAKIRSSFLHENDD
ncbi:hypothetical protein RirG_090090 [Rhizophagus irregularis DAOM 197198w]|uniref:Uncharacterized protein n=5 Tax=Rhizophagus irregularis TaxID=588596 RepID=A0A015JKY0_RHIIW|nr:hypothetical protein RirG_090090 [Rhizophagus irregularis DAOM 197198w]